MENVTTRMDEDDIDLVEKLADELGVSRSDAIRIAVKQGSKEKLIEIALQKYSNGEVGMRGAAKIAETTISEIMHEANERGIMMNYDETDLEQDIENL